MSCSLLQLFFHLFELKITHEDLAHFHYVLKLVLKQVSSLTEYYQLDRGSIKMSLLIFLPQSQSALYSLTFVELK